MTIPSWTAQAKPNPWHHVDFEFLPTTLAKKSRRLLEGYHELRGYGSLPDFLWDAEIREFIEMHDQLNAIFKKASRSRSAKRSTEYYLLVATIILSMETLVSDFAGWGARFPDARRKAVAIVTAFRLPFGTRLLDHYLSPRSYIPPEVLRSMLPD
jgi:hypothetical protein